MHDLRYAVRALQRTPALTAVILVTLALGIGATTAIFTAVNAIALRPLPYPEPERVVALWQTDSAQDTRRGAVSPMNLEDWRQAATLENVGAVTGWRPTLSGIAVPESLAGALVSHQVLPLLGVQPELGRWFTPAEDVPGAPPVAILSHSLWQRIYGGDPAIVGRLARLAGVDHEVVGVMPSDFRMAQREASEIWRPLAIDPVPYGYGSAFLTTVGRLVPDVDLEDAQSELNTIAERLRQEHPENNANVGVNVESLHDETIGDTAPRLYMLLGAVGFVMLIAVANIANVLAARASARREEIAVRAALGAGRGRLARQLLTESMLLGLAGGALGLLLASWGTSALVIMAPADIPRLDQVRPDLAVALFALGLSVAAGLLFGSAPALHAARTGVGAVVRGSGRGFGRGGLRVRQALVIGQVAVALVLLIGSGLLLNSLFRLLAEDPGFRPEGVLTARISLGEDYAGAGNQERFYTDLRGRLVTDPGVEGVATIFQAPFGGGMIWGSFEISGRPEPADGEEPLATISSVSPEYFDVLGISLRRGRGFGPEDEPGGEPVLMINEAAAARYWPNEDPLGEMIRVGVTLDDQERGVPRRIIGVTANVKYAGLGTEDTPRVYMPARQYPTYAMYALIRTTGPPLAFAPRLREMLAEMDPDLALSRVRSLESLVSASLATDRFMAVLLSSFAFVALTLGCVGIYGVLSYSVTERTREIGVRMALGARAADVRAMLLRNTAVLAGSGLLIGLVASTWVTRTLRGFLYEVEPGDPATIGATCLVLAAVALLAAVVPARRAAGVDPATALRAD